MAIKADLSLNCSAPARRTKLTGEMASIRPASRSRPAQQQSQRARWRASLLPVEVEWAKLRRSLASGMPPDRRTQWSNGCSRRSSAAQQRATRHRAGWAKSAGDPEGSHPRHRAVCGGASCRRNGRHHALAGRNWRGGRRSSRSRGIGY